MTTITIPRTEYTRMQCELRAYHTLRAQLFSTALSAPITQVVDDFTATGKYSPEFLKDLAAGLKKSSYSKRMQAA